MIKILECFFLLAEFAKGVEFFFFLSFMFPNDFSIQYDKILAPIEAVILLGTFFAQKIKAKAGIWLTKMRERLAPNKSQFSVAVFSHGFQIPELSLPKNSYSLLTLNLHLTAIFMKLIIFTTQTTRYASKNIAYCQRS